MLPCQDNFTTTFSTYPEMLSHHERLSKESVWRRCKVSELHVEPLDLTSALYGNLSEFVAGTSNEAVSDTAENLGLALRVGGDLYPIRMTAYKTLLDRAKISGTALPKLKRKELADVLNACLAVHSSEALLLVRDEKVSATHSGDARDYSVLPIDELLHTLEKNGYRIRLTQVEYAILKLFMQNPGRALSREEILSAVWGRDYEGELKIVDVNIRRLRIKIEDDTANPTYITTVWGFGYKWGA